MVVSSPVGDVKIVFPVSPFVLNTLKLKLSAFLTIWALKRQTEYQLIKKQKEKKMNRKESVVVNDNTKRVNVSKFIVPEIQPNYSEGSTGYFFIRSSSMF